MSAAVAPSRWKNQRRRVFHSVFQTDFTQPTPYSTPSARFPDFGQAFGGPHAGHSPFGHPHAPGDLPGTPLQRPGFGLGGPFSSPDALRSPSSTHPHTGASEIWSPSQPDPPLQSEGLADDQVRYDRAWHIVTTRISLPSSVAAEDSFGTLAPESQYQSQGAGTEADFQAALRLVLHVKTALPRARHTEDLLGWHMQQVRRHFVQHVLPMLSACAGAQAGATDSTTDASLQGDARFYDKHMAIVMSSIRTLEAALRLYFYGLSLILRGLPPGQDLAVATETDASQAAADAVAMSFKRDIHALIGNSTSAALMHSIRVVFQHLMSAILGLCDADGNRPASAGKKTQEKSRPAPPDERDSKIQALRRRLHELVEALAEVGLAGERFEILFAEMMDALMSDFVTLSYSGLWISVQGREEGQNAFMRKTRSATASAGSGLPSPCIASLCDWIENHYARLALEVMGRISKGRHEAVSLSHVKQWKEIGVGRLASLRISELFDIVMQWPASKGALDDLRASVTTPQRRLQLTNTLSATLQRKLLHPARSTLEILQVYISMIRTLHALDNSKVLLGRVATSLQLYLCQREDAVRIVVTGLLADPEEAKEKRQTAEGQGDSSKEKKLDTLVELAVILNDPSQQRRQTVEDEELDWNDMTWVPDPVDAGVNYKRPKSEDVIGTLISALGSQDVFIKEFQSIVAERLLAAKGDISQEIKVLNLLKKRFGEGALQHCEVMIRDIQEGLRVDTVINRVQKLQRRGLATPGTPAMAGTPQGGGGPVTPQGPPGTPLPAVLPRGGAQPEDNGGVGGGGGMEYHSRILSRLYWPNLVKDTFLLPNEVVERQRQYEAGFEHMKGGRRLNWLNYLGRASVELELEDRTVAADCKIYEATVIYAFQNEGEDGGEGGDNDDDATRGPVTRSVEDLYMLLQMDDDLVAAALEFWAGLGVLRRVEGTTYAVVERLGEAGEAAASAAGPEGADEDEDEDAAAGPASPHKSAGQAGSSAAAADARDKARRELYWNFIRGMLTNAASSMPLAQMAMMMKMMIAEGFAWGNEELQEFLGEKVREGELEVVGGKYRLVKK